MHEPMSAPLLGAGPQRSTHHNHNQHHNQHQQASGSQSPSYHSAASSPSSSSISSPVSSSSMGTSSSSGISSSTFSPPHSSSGALNCQLQHHQSVPKVNELSSNTQLSGEIIQPNEMGHNSANKQNGSQQHTKNVQQQRGQQTVVRQSTNNNNNNNGQANMSSSLFDHFPELEHDGARMTWFHGANNRASLNTAMMSNHLFISGDISLAEMSRYPVPIMARPPLGVSDLTLENWLADMTRTRKGIKLTFTSTRTVEPAFRVLARHAEHIKGPLILSADILTRPAPNSGPKQTNSNNGRQKQQPQAQSQQQQAQSQQPVDAWTFLMLCRTRFPRSIISIGWCSGQTTPNSPAPPSPSELGATPFGSSADSMFELDIDNQLLLSRGVFHAAGANGSPAASSGGAGAASGVQQQTALMQQLAAAAAQAQHHGGQLLPPRLGQHSHTGAANNHRNQQQAGGASAATLAALHRLSPGNTSIHNFHNQHNHFTHQHYRNPHHHHQHKHHLSSSGSLSSNSSDNSSGSPSPTSPLSQHLVHHHRSYHNHGHAHIGHPHSESPERHQLLLAAAAAAAASQHHHNQQQQQLQQADQKVTIETAVDWQAAVAAAAMVAASSMQQQQQQQQQQHENQLPLNLNINEADPKHTASTLNDLAQRIQSINRQQRVCAQQQQQPTPPTSTTIMNINKIQLQHQQKNLASKLISSVGAGKLLNLATANDWQHINKKAAVTSCLNSDGPSPISTSPKQQQQLSSTKQSTNLLCLSKQTQQNNNDLKQQQQKNLANLSGYTREMIDKMASLVKEYNLTQPITFPVEARLLLRNNDSLNELQRLLYQVGSNSTLTIVAQPEDLIGVDDLLQMRKHFSPQQILFDLPDGLASALKQEIDLM